MRVIVVGRLTVYQRGLVIDSQPLKEQMQAVASISKGIGD